MGDLRSRGWIVAKGLMFAVLVGMTGVGVILHEDRWFRVGFLLVSLDEDAQRRHRACKAVVQLYDIHFLFEKNEEADLADLQNYEKALLSFDEKDLPREDLRKRSVQVLAEIRKAKDELQKRNIR